MPPIDSVVFHDVLFRHDAASLPLFGGPVRAHLPRGFTGIVGPNGAGKTTLLRLATGALVPGGGRVSAPGRAVYCEQRTDAPPEGLADLLEASDAAACTLRTRLGVDRTWGGRWSSLSHGERKRLQLGAALHAAPDLLALDEPTNHVDAETRAVLLGVLRSFGGVGLLVSHDRELLDALCVRCLFLEPSGAVLRPGGYTQGCSIAEAERAAAERARASARRERVRLEREAASRQAEAARSDRRRSKRGLSRHDHDARGRIDLARVTGKDGMAGKLLRQLDGRVRQAQEREAAIRVDKVRRLGIWLPGERARRDRVAALPAQRLALGGGRWLDLPDLIVRPADRIAVTGPNGAGKSTLVGRLLDASAVPASRLTVVPQEIEAATGRGILAEARALPPAELGFVMSVVSCLGSRPERLLETAEPSPGELRKLLLALGLRRAPQLVVLDEPTNHLDLPSIECLEDALAACPCALVLVSHDRRFLERLTTSEWRIGPDGALGLSAVR